jgi:hypothetical protein
MSVCLDVSNENAGECSSETLEEISVLRNIKDAGATRHDSL